MCIVASPHFVIFPFMSPSHTIPLLHLATLLRHRSIAVTIFTTPANAPSIRDFLRDVSISVVELPFPKDVHDIPPGVENTEKLPSMSYFGPFVTATKLMQPLFEQALSALQHPPTCVKSDSFFGWSQESAEKIGIPRYYFSGMSLFAMTLCPLLSIERPHADTISPDESFTFSSFPWLKFTRNDFPPPFGDLEPRGPAVDFVNEQEKQPVLYVAFGTQADISAEQIQEIAKGLELSKSCFLWVTRQKVLEHLQGFENRVKNRGLIVKEWVDQNEVLRHKSIKGFLSHCGWNSVLERICAKVPILALPLMAEQHVNSRMVTDEIGVGLRIMPRNGSVRGFVEAEEVKKMVRELMEGEKGERVRKKVKELGEKAEEAMEEDGSSCSALGLFIDDACAGKL